MALPIIPVAVTAGLAGLTYLLFGKKDEPTAKPSNQLPPATAQVPVPQTPAAPPLQQIPNSRVPHQPTLPPARRPPDLPPPVQPTPVIPAPSSGPMPPVPPARPPVPPPLVLPLPSPPPAVNPLPPLPLPQPPTPPAPIPPPVQPTQETGTVTAPSGVNLRGAPTTSGPILYGMVKGTRVKILGHSATPTAGAPKGWYNVLAPNGMVGWATAEHILPDGLPAPTPVLPSIPGLLPAVLPSSPNNPIPTIPLPPIPSSTMTATVLGTPGANLRAAPSTSGTLIKGLFNGTKVTVLNPKPTAPTTGAPKGWVNVRGPAGEIGWMSAEFLRPDWSTGFAGEDFDRLVRGEGTRKTRWSIR